MSQLIELREVTQENYNRLSDLVNDINRDPKYTSHKSNEYDYPHLPSMWPQNILPHSYLVAVALGEPNSEYPNFQFDDHTLLGWYAVHFDPLSHPRLQIESNKRGFHVFEDISYVPPEFRGRGVSTQLSYFMEFILRKYGYGEIEVKAGNPVEGTGNPIVIKSLKRRGYQHVVYDRWAKDL